MSDNESDVSGKLQPEFPQTGLDSSESNLSDDEVNDAEVPEPESPTAEKDEKEQPKKSSNKPNLFGASSSDDDDDDGEHQQEQQIVDHDEHMDENEEEGVKDNDSSSDDSSDDEGEKKEEKVNDNEVIDFNEPDATADDSFLPQSPVYEEDSYLQEHESRMLNMSVSGGKRRVAIHSDDSDDEEQAAKRPHQQLEDDDEDGVDPFAEPLNQNEAATAEDPDTSDTEKPDPRKLDDDHDPSISDFDRAMQRKKKEAKKRRKPRGDSTFISEADDQINELMRQMAEASAADKEASLNKIPAINKLKLLPKVDATFKVKDYHESFIENGVMTAIADWLTPLPNNFLPNLNIRTVLLSTLVDFPHCSIETLKASGVGKAVNRLLQHPKELQDNKRKCKTLIRRYSKQIFGIVDTGAVSKEERQNRDLETLRRYGPSKKTKYQQLRDQQMEEQSRKRVHEKGFIPRARVPMPSNRDYLVRPKDNIDPDTYPTSKSGSKKMKTGTEALMDKTKKRIMETKRKLKLPQAKKVSLSGGKGMV